MLGYTDLVAHVTWVLSNRTDVSTYAGRWVNWAYLDLWNKVEAHSKESITSGTLTIAQNYISIPATTTQVLRVTITDIPLEKEEWREFTKIQTFASAKPSKYYIYADRIYFDTAPDDDYAYDVWKVLGFTAISGSTQPSLPDCYEPVLITRAVAYGYRDLQMDEESIAWFAKADEQYAGIQPQFWKENEDWQHGLRLSPTRRSR